jgi:hypothetical protein
MPADSEQARRDAVLARLGRLFAAAPVETLEDVAAQLEPLVEEYDPVAEGKAMAAAAKAATARNADAMR